MHTAEHILGGTMVRMFGTKRAVTTHLESKKSKVDFLFDRNLTAVEVEQLALSINNIIDTNCDVTTTVMDPDEAAAHYDLSQLPPEACGQKLRIVHVGDYDSCPCIGEHVANTAEIGHMRIISTDHNGDILRIRFKLSPR